MSAYIVDNRTIDIIVDGMAAFDVYVVIDGRVLRPRTSDTDRQTVGQMLLDQNYASVNARYNEAAKATEYKRALPQYVRGLSGFQSVKALNVLTGCASNYEYQACETDDWKGSPLHCALCNLEYEVLRKLLDRAGMPNCWGIESDEELAELLK